MSEFIMALDMLVIAGRLNFTKPRRLNEMFLSCSEYDSLGSKPSEMLWSFFGVRGSLGITGLKVSEFVSAVPDADARNVPLKS